MSKGLITVFGGSGFVGRYVVRALCKAGFRVRVAVRRPHLAGDLRMPGDVGQVQLAQANVRDLDSVKAAVNGSDGVVNLVGILFESGKQSFEKTQAQGALHVAQAAQASGITRLVHVSAIGADETSKAAYARTKAQAEASVREHVPTATILRPSIVFGAEDQFFNRFAQMATMSPLLPLVGGGRTRFQPVHVADVADAVVAALTRPDAQGQTYELGGPRTYTFRELLDYIQKTADRKRLYLPLPFPVAGFAGLMAGAIFRIPPMVGLFGGPPLTAAQVEMLKTDNVVSPKRPGFAELGITELETVESVVPSYLYRFRPQGQFTDTGKTG